MGQLSLSTTPLPPQRLANVAEHRGPPSPRTTEKALSICQLQPGRGCSLGPPPARTRSPVPRHRPAPGRQPRTGSSPSGPDRGPEAQIQPRSHASAASFTNATGGASARPQLVGSRPLHQELLLAALHRRRPRKIGPAPPPPTENWTRAAAPRSGAFLLPAPLPPSTPLRIDRSGICRRGLAFENSRNSNKEAFCMTFLEMLV